jgi:hypothetical protein
VQIFLMIASMDQVLPGPGTATAMQAPGATKQLEIRTLDLLHGNDTYNLPNSSFAGKFR